MSDGRGFPDNCVLCGTPVRVEGHTTKYYVTAYDAAIKKRDAEIERLKAALNRIAILGASGKAYTADFTTEVMGLVRRNLEETK